jgi:hypothetical protein
LFGGYGSSWGLSDRIVTDNRDMLWCGNANSDLIAPDFDDGDDDVFANQYLLIGLA